MGCKKSEVRILSSRPIKKRHSCGVFFCWLWDKGSKLRERRFDYKRKPSESAAVSTADECSERSNPLVPTNKKRPALMADFLLHGVDYSL